MTFEWTQGRRSGLIVQAWGYRVIMRWKHLVAETRVDGRFTGIRLLPLLEVRRA